MTLADARAAIAAAPDGAHVAAFFDFDGTVIDTFSAIALLRRRLQTGQIGPVEGLALLHSFVRTAAGQSDVEDFMTTGVRHLAGRREADLVKLGVSLTRSEIGGTLHYDALALIDAHQAKGHTVVIATSALPYQVDTLARELGAQHVLCTRPRVVDGVLDGGLAGPILWGPGKAQAVVEFARERSIDVGGCFAYANGDEDAPFLGVVGHPVAVNAEAGLGVVAEASRWPRLTMAARERPGLVDTARSVAAYAGMATAFGVGLGVGLLNRNRRDAVNTSIGIAGEVSLALAGVRLDVAGAGHLWSARPAVFIFNHQSWLDGLIVMKLLGGDFTGVAKKEVAAQPGIGQFARLADMAFVDRANGADARKALEPVVERLRGGTSIVIAPEGTRSITPRVGAFKKGAFHLAMQAGVPIVPMVIRNAGDLMWRGSNVIRAGTVDVIVHPPMSVAGWKRAKLDARVADVRALFVDTLADWEGARAAVTCSPGTGRSRARASR